MRNRNERIEAIRRLVSEIDVKNQGQMMELLKERGCTVTQATLSRDLKKMKISKVANTYGEYVYVLPNMAQLKKSSEPDMQQVTGQPRYGFVSMQFSGNLAVIRTKPGYAGSLAYDIDNASIPEVLGTIAGDDTIILVLSEHSNHAFIKRLLEPIIISM